VYTPHGLPCVNAHTLQQAHTPISITLRRRVHLHTFARRLLTVAAAWRGVRGCAHTGDVSLGKTSAETKSREQQRLQLQVC